MSRGKSLLVLEGGGLRGVFTAGVLEAFLEANLQFDQVFGVSAGATSAVTYLSGQRGRNKRVFINYNDDPRYMGLRSYLRTGNYFNKDFIFETIPNELDPFDHASFLRQAHKLSVPVTDALTGQTEYLSDFSTAEKLTIALKAATALPMMARPEQVGPKLYFDGGISCPLVFDALDFEGYDSIVYVLTQPEGYRKQPSRHPHLVRLLMHRYPSVSGALERRHRVYNETLEKIEHLGMQRPNFHILRPDGSIPVRRTERDKTKLHQSYEHGYSLGALFTGMIK